MIHGDPRVPISKIASIDVAAYQEMAIVLRATLDHHYEFIDLGQMRAMLVAIWKLELI